MMSKSTIKNSSGIAFVLAVLFLSVLTLVDLVFQFGLNPFENVSGLIGIVMLTLPINVLLAMLIFNLLRSSDETN